MPLLEVIVSSLDDAHAAHAGGADRFELCSALALGGLTPSLGLLDAIKASYSTPVVFMVRPREAGMAYSDADLQVMLRDAALAIEHGADGIVFGFLTEPGHVDVGRTREFVAHCRRLASRPLQLVFHRAFDVVADPDVALEQLVDLGITRILTSGRAARASDGVAEIRRMIELARDRIEILPGGGITPATVREVLDQTGAEQVHLSLTHAAGDRSAAHNPEIHFGCDTPPTELEFRASDEAAIRTVRQLIDG